MRCLALRLSRVHQAARTRGPRRRAAGRGPRSRDCPRARAGAGRLQHRRHGPLAGLQRYLAGGGMGPSFRQSRRHPGRRRLLSRPWPTPAPLLDGRRARRHDQGPRDTGRAGAGEQLQPCGTGSRAAGAHRLHGSGRRACWAAVGSRSSMPCPMPGSTVVRCAPTVTRRTPARAKAGRRATPLQPSRAHGAAGHDRRDGLPVGLDGADAGVFRTCCFGVSRWVCRSHLAVT